MTAPTDCDIVSVMIGYGGSFVSALGNACRHADADNLARIKAAFPEYWAKYAAMVPQPPEPAAPAMPLPPEVGNGWRLLDEGEPIREGDGFLHPDFPNWWTDYACRPDLFRGKGREVAHKWPWRRKKWASTSNQPTPDPVALPSLDHPTGGQVNLDRNAAIARELK